MKKIVSLILTLLLFVSISVPVNADLAEYETEDVYLLGDGESTRMSPGLFWDMAFTGKSTMKYAGKEVEVWRFPAEAKVGLDDWSYIPQIVAYYQVEDVEVDESFRFEGGVPFALPSIDAIYCISLRDYDGKICKQYYVKSEAAASENEASDWAKSEVEAAKAAGLVPALTGNPGYQDAITREQFAELVVNLVAGCGANINAGDVSFSDCDNINVLLAASAGIVNGVGENRFAPETTTNREQIATMLYRAIGYIKEQNGQNPLSEAGSVTAYVDKGEVSDWAAEGVGALAANGIMKGTSDTTLSPKAPCTVEQSIILIYRLYMSYITE